MTTLLLLFVAILLVMVWLKMSKESSSGQVGGGSNGYTTLYLGILMICIVLTNAYIKTHII